MASQSREERIGQLLREMTTAEKVGQLCQVDGAGGQNATELRTLIRQGRAGSVLNEVDVQTVNELQRIAVEESRMGIPLLIGRDVIHGFKTVFPIPLGLAASWNPELITEAARISALEAASHGVNWTFAPICDIGRDPRWGRIAETFGEDPYLNGTLAVAMVRGYQGDDLAAPGNIAACAKHFAGYGASESGRDYNTASIPEHDLRNVHLRPFKAALDAGVATFMTSFSDLNGVPATGNEWLLKQILREEWHFDGLVVSDWDAITQLSVHGLTANDKEAAYHAAMAGVDMEMAGKAYSGHLADLVEEGVITELQLDTMVANVLRAKFRLGLFDDASTNPDAYPAVAAPSHLAIAREAAVQGLVLLKNDHSLLPFAAHELSSLALIGPLANDPYEQLGTWVFDGDPQCCETPLHAINEMVHESAAVRHVRAMETTRSKSRFGFAEAVEAAERSDAAVLFLGEEAVLSGESHCRADVRLPGNQEDLVEAVADTGTPTVVVLMCGRPLALERIVNRVDAIVCAWHPGTMAGPAIADVLFGVRSPSGKLPVTFPRVTGQIPIYYAHKNTGKPATPETIVHIDAIAPRAPQTSVGNTSFHLDAGHTPLFPFGHGLSYTEFEYRDIRISRAMIPLGESFSVAADLTNTGNHEAEEVAQLYVRDLVGNVTRPVKELRGFQKVRLRPGDTTSVVFALHTDDLAFYDRNMRLVTEPGMFHAWIGGHSDPLLRVEFEVVPPNSAH